MVAVRDHTLPARREEEVDDKCHDSARVAQKGGVGWGHNEDGEDNGPALVASSREAKVGEMEQERMESVIGGLPIRTCMMSIHMSTSNR